MKKTGIMTDSHSGILPEEAERLGIRVLPMPFYIGEKLYREGVDLSRDEFYDMLRNRIYSAQQCIKRFLYGSSGNGK